jgi:hypothetical protein
MNKDVRPPRNSTESASASGHVPLERLVALLLDGTPLNNVEHFHLMRCSECTQAMIQAASARLRGPGDSIQ